MSMSLPLFDLNAARVTKDSRRLACAEGLQVVTPAEQWAYALVIPRSHVPEPRGEAVVEATLVVESGLVGVCLVNRDGTHLVADEKFVAPGDSTTICLYLPAPGEAGALVLRNAAAGQQTSCFRLNTVTDRSVGETDITAVIHELFPFFIKDSVALRQTVSSRLGWREHDRIICRDFSSPIDHDGLWQDACERVVLKTAHELIDNLEHFVPALVGQHNVHLNRDFYRQYLYMSVTRVVGAIRLLEKLGLPGGRVLEVGSFFGLFALSLQRLGYEVTAIDRYDSYGIDGGAFAHFLGLLRDEGVTVISSDRDSEYQIIGQCGMFDCTASFAVIEHIPHTPREFLSLLRNQTRSGGVILLDTPNLTRHHNVKLLAQGKSIFNDIKEQFYCKIPFEGHHREYTRGELAWMLEEVGCVDIISKYLNYNPLQFSSVNQTIVEDLVETIHHPQSSDTIIIGGRVT